MIKNNKKSLVLILALYFASTAALAADRDLTNIPLEQLLQTEVKTASMFAQQVSDAPSAVTVITAEDIKTYGYRTLADALSSVRGLSITNDRVYSTLVGRGFGRAGDFTERIMMLIDGYQANDNIYNQSFIGADGVLDMDMIERIEYVSGPGSVTYGSNAFFGMINVVTKKGRNFNGGQAAFEFSSYQGKKARLSYGKRFENGADILLSASAYGQDGQNYYFPEFDSPSTNNGRSVNLDKDNNHRIFGKGHYGNWTFEAGYNTRVKDDPTNSFGTTDFNTRPRFFQDSNGYASLRHDADLSENLKSSIHAYYGQYQFIFRATFGGDLVPRIPDEGRWWGVDAKLFSTTFANHNIVLGAEYRNDYKLVMDNVNRHAYMASVYLQDDYLIQENLHLNMGARWDYDGDDTHGISPRLALIYTPQDSTTLKASYSTAFRRPTVYEKWFVALIGNTRANPDLKNEKVYATELVLEHQFDKKTRLLGSLYHYRTKDFIAGVYFPAPDDFQQFFNTGSNQTKGAELELDKRWENGVNVRASYARQQAKDGTGLQSINSAKDVAKLNVSTPLFNRNANLGLEVQYVGDRVYVQDHITGDKGRLPSYTLTNLTLSSNKLLPNVEASFSVRNLFDRDYVDPAHIYSFQTTLPQDGRNVWLQMIYDF